MTNAFTLSFWIRSIRSLLGVRTKAHITQGRNCLIARGAHIRTSLTLEDDVLISHGCIIDGGPVFIGRGTNLLPGNWVVGPAKIGRYCAIARGSSFLATNHPTNFPGMQSRFYKEVVGAPLEAVGKGAIELGNDVWVGTSAIITSGVKIGDGAVIGAGSVVTKNVAPYSLTAGNPASQIKNRFSQEIIAQLLSLKWWDWPNDRIHRNKRFFTTDLNEVIDLQSIVVD